jgi:release factor glutamine methyltransferase
LTLDEAVAALAGAGVDTPRLDAEVLLAHALGVERLDLFVRDHEPPAGFERLIRRRARREPVAYLTATRAFRRLELYVDPRVLIPRPETEHLVEAALGLAAGASVVDVGTGSGAVALALKDERPDLQVTGTDISAAAVDVASLNAYRLGLDVAFVQGDLLAGLTADAVVSNPPYVESGATLAAELDYEPRGALAAGTEGMDVIAQLVPAALASGASWRSSTARTRRARSPRCSRARSSSSATSPDTPASPSGALSVAGAALSALAHSVRGVKAAFEACIRAGGVVLFGADTVYGLACDAEDADAVERLYALKGRAPDKPAAVMFFDLADVPPLPMGTEALLPGPVTLLVGNPERRFPLACGPTPEVLGIRVPAGTALAGARVAVLQSSANAAGGADARSLADVPADIRAGVDLELDAGELPGTPSTVIDVTGEHWRIVREGAVSPAEVASRLGP